MADVKIRKGQIETLGIDDITSLQTTLDDINAKIIVDADTPGISVGMWVWGTRAGINNGDEFIGVVVNTALTDDAHVKFIARVTER